MADSYMVVAHPDKTKLDFVCFMKKPIADAAKRFEKLSTYDPKVCYLQMTNLLFTHVIHGYLSSVITYHQ